MTVRINPIELIGKLVTAVGNVFTYTKRLESFSLLNCKFNNLNCFEYQFQMRLLCPTFIRCYLQ